MGDGWTFIGTVESINVRGEGPTQSHECLVGMKSAAGDLASFRLEPHKSARRYEAMLQLATSGLVSRGIIAVNARPAADRGPPYVWEIDLKPPEWRIRAGSVRTRLIAVCCQCQHSRRASLTQIWRSSVVLSALFRAAGAAGHDLA